MWQYRFAWGKNGQVYRDDDPSAKFPQRLKEYISALGRDGWELCGTLPEGDGHTLIFKRVTDQ